MTLFDNILCYLGSCNSKDEWGCIPLVFVLAWTIQLLMLRQ